MAGVAHADLLDLVNLTLPKLPSGHVENALLYQATTGVNEIFSPMRRRNATGESISLRVSLTENGTAKMVDEYEAITPSVKNTTHKVLANWVNLNNHYVISEREVDMNRGSAVQLASLYTQRELDALSDKINVLENQTWGVPNSASDTLNAWGIQYWISMLTSGQSDPVGGFNGMTIQYGNSSTSTVKGGIDASVAANSRWRNWVATYDQFDGNLLKTMARCCQETKFIPSPELAKLYRGKSQQMCWYMDQQNYVDYVELVNMGNDDRDGDAYPYALGDVKFMRIPVYPVPALDSLAANPIYLVNHNRIWPFVLTNWWMRRGVAVRDTDRPTTFVVPLDSTFQIFSDNVRECGAVIHNVLA